MGSSIILKLLNVTHYYRNQQSKKWYAPFGYEVEDIELNNISLHIYEGEALGILGEPQSSKEVLGSILAGETKPDKGKYILRTDLYYGDIHDKHLHTETVQDLVAQSVKMFPVKVNDHKVSQILKYAHLADKSDVQVCQLSDSEYAQLLFGLARTSHSSILIFNQVIRHLNEHFFDEAINLSREYIEDNLTMLVIDDDIQRLPQVTNYLAWISHGQLRKEGSIRQLLPVFQEHEKDRQSLTTEEEHETFDHDWKASRSHMPELTYNFKRVERYNHAKPPVALTRFWTLLVTFTVGALLMVALMFANLGVIPMPKNTAQETIQNQQAHSFEDNLAYGVVLDSHITLKGLHHTSNRQAARYSLLTITGENSKHYRVEIDGKHYQIAKNDVRYFDPAGLYEKHSRETLSTYMGKSYSNYYEYYNSHLHQQHKKVTDSLVPEKGKNNRLVVPVTEQPISMLFNDENKLTGFVYPMTDKSKLKQKYDIKGNTWIAKSDDGYYIADLKHNKWLYIEL